MKLNKIGYYEINFVDSAATNRMKTGSGAGESRLYLGQVSRFDEIYDFFSEDVRFYFFCKNDLLNYLRIAKEEYFNPTQEYREKKLFPKFYQENLQEIQVLEEDYLEFNFTRNYDSSRCFIRLVEDEYSNDNYEVMRKICIPKMTKLAFVKYVNQNNNAQYIKVMPIFSKPYTAQELGAILKKHYENSEQKNVEIHLFVYDYGKYIIEQNLSLDIIIREAKLNDNEAGILHNAIEVFKRLYEDNISVNASETIIVDDGEYEVIKDNMLQLSLPLQRIFYGAPGTGKSHKTNEITREYSDTIRTTFHPDSDYSTFVGAYKPTTTEEKMYGLDSHGKTVPYEYAGKPLETTKIVYKFIPQAFIKAYIQAWKKMAQMTITTNANFNGQPIILQSNKSHLSWKITEIKSQDIYLESCFKLVKEDFKKSAKDLWDKAWKSGEYTQDVFTSFTRYEQTICNWIYRDIGTNDFEGGWDRFIAELNNGTLELRVNPFKDSKQKPYYYRLEGDNIIINAMLHTTYDDLYDYFEKDKEPSKYQQAVGNLLASYSNDYDEAWKKLEEELKQVDGSRYTIKVESQFLVIEEINRGNCAQIFGDLFQLLDRTKNGFSEYPIEADEDISKYIKEELKELAFNQEIIDYINQQFVDGDMNPLTYDIDDNRVYALDAILNGKILVLPANLYIWATMNTSDQSLFPIDSAFKRRWDWEYMPIYDAGKNWKIKVGETTYDWWKFIDAINDQINITTSSEDKKLGYFFCKPCEGDNILATKFVNKVIFYLWNDVFKDYELPVAFNYGDSKKKPANSPSDHMSFNDFYTDKNVCIHQLMKNLKVQPDGHAEEPEVIEEPTEEIEA